MIYRWVGVNVYRNCPDHPCGVRFNVAESQVGGRRRNRRYAEGSSGSGTVSSVCTEDPARHLRKIQQVIGADVYWKSTVDWQLPTLFCRW
jgi:hypothetical protein